MTLPTEPLAAWQRVFRAGAPLLSTPGLLALRAALESDDPRLLQGATTTPPPLACVQDWPVEAACLIGFCAWLGDGLQTVAQVEEAFARLCSAVDQKLGEPAACRWLLNAWDEWPRSTAIANLLPEVDRELNRRSSSCHVA